MSEARRRALLAVGVVLFGAVFAVGWMRLPADEVEWAWLAASLAVIPVIMVLNALEYRVAARLVAHRVPFEEAMRVSILGSAANLLPVPGAVLVRTGALKRRGAAMGPSAMATGAVGAGWLGLSALLAGLLLALSGNVPVGAGFAAVGFAATAGMLFLTLRAGGAWRDGALIVALEAAFVCVSAVRTWATLQALGGGGVAQAAALTVAAPLAAAAGILPGGLGLREVIAGAVSPLVGLDAATGVVASGLDRLLGLAALGVGAWIYFGRAAEKT